MSTLAILARLQEFTELDESDIVDLTTLVGQVRPIIQGSVLRSAGNSSSTCYLVLQGWLAGSVDFADGKRQMTKVYLPGDLAASSDISFSSAAETLTAITRCEVMILNLKRLSELFTINPRLAFVLYLISQQERGLLNDRLSSLGRRSAESRIAILFLQIKSRLQYFLPEMKCKFSCPLSQMDIADLCGLSNVHVSRTLAKLKKDGVLVWSRSSVIISDIVKLEALAGLSKRVTVRDESWFVPRNSRI